VFRENPHFFFIFAPTNKKIPHMAVHNKRFLITTLVIVFVIILFLVIGLVLYFVLRPHNKTSSSSDNNPSTTTTLTLVEESSTADDFLNPAKWRLYIGRTAYASPAALTGLVSKDFYWDTVNLTSLEPLMTPDGYYNGMWFQDPTNGIQSYLVGAANADILVAKDSATGGTALKSMKFKNNAAAIQAKAPEFGIATLRLESRRLVRNAVIVINAFKIPTGCGAWPAFWLVGTPNREIWETGINSGHAFDGGWPAFGEVDIIEQVNTDKNKNHFTLHTTAGCTSTMSTTSGGTLENSDCNSGGAPASILEKARPRDPSAQNGTQGCSMTVTSESDMKKGVYVCQVADEVIRLWFFPDPTVAPIRDVLTADTLDVNTLGAPVGVHALPTADCDPLHFQNLRMVINLAICGDWAGNVACNDNTDKLGISYATGPTNCATSYGTQLSYSGPSSSPTTVPNIDVNNPDDPRLADLQWILGCIRVFE